MKNLDILYSYICAIQEVSVSCAQRLAMGVMHSGFMPIGPVIIGLV